MNDTLTRILKKLNLDPLADYSEKSPMNLTHFGRNDLAKLFAELGFQRGAEIGVESGAYTEVLCRANPNSSVFGIDAWMRFSAYRDHVSQEKLDTFHDRAKERLKDYDVELIREFSMDAVKRFPLLSLDWVYIDAHHGFDYVMQDLIEWTKRVRSGGICSGHDYFTPKNNDVMQFGVIPAVDAYVAAHGIAPLFILRGDAPRVASWMFIKQ